MVTDYRRLTPDDTAQNTVQLILQGWQADFPVVSDGEYVGIVTRQDVVTALEAGNPLQPVANFMRIDALHCGPEDDLDAALQTLRSSHLPLLPVLGEGRLIGLLTSENILEALMFRRALSQRIAPPPMPVNA
jgi:CBS domain-containing protein